MKSITQTINERATKTIIISPITIKKYLKYEGMDQSTVDWYRSEFPDDRAWGDIKDVTFAEFLEELANFNRDENYDMRGDTNGKIDFERYIGCDSIIRERLFNHLSRITGISYSSFYNKYFDR